MEKNTSIEDLSPAAEFDLYYLRYTRRTRLNTKADAEPSEWRTAIDKPSLSIPPLFMKVARIDEIFHQILAIVNGPAEDESGKLTPTRHALGRAMDLLTSACFEFLNGVENVFPVAFVSPDLEGGLRIEWTRPGGVITLVVPPSNERHCEYLCTRIDGVSRVEPRLSGVSIASWLQRLS